MAEQKLAQLKKDYGVNHAEYEKTAELAKDLEQKISTRTDGIMLEMNERVRSLKEGLDQVSNEVEVAKGADISGAAKMRPYFEAKNKLDELQRFNMALTM